ncbi:RBP11-like subunits of RNA polymerase [Nadsonia fulvescens var. elongata DSM 6958]|uniref:DNA-directed RNA polymerases I and III subunit RPAC1 n=1 Tax=Nadsonia fulvescens var. elongata DSM 6958 TaxID=857566 RepID=A0A1E3PJ29_9ASCO|nr:RBP11-like subunits of RNA polymerase [Nadsonia fulvescens var. elongata DSM 6958]
MPSITDKDRRNLVGIEHDRVTDVKSTDFPGHYPGEDNSWDLAKFRQQFSVNISHLTDLVANFDLVGLDTSVANAFRRIMIAEIPSIAVEEVFIHNNTSVIQDEVLAHRLGMIPLKAPAELLGELPNIAKPEIAEHYNDDNTIVLQLHIVCFHNPDAPKGATDPKELYINSNVYARDIKFEAVGKQLEWTQEIQAVNPDILIAKLRPGQEIDLTMHCHLGVGCDHAKFSPVATASYRILPVIEILQPITGDQAVRFQKCFPSGVIGINTTGEAFVQDARRDTVSREVLRHEEFDGMVKLGRRRDHFIFNVESTGAMQPDEIFLKSVRELKRKAAYLRQYNLREN